MQLSFCLLPWEFSQERPVSLSLLYLLYSWWCQTSISMILTITIIDTDAKNRNIFRKVLRFRKWIPIHFCDKWTQKTNKWFLPTVEGPVYVLYASTGSLLRASWKHTWSLTFPWKARKSEIGVKVREAILVPTLPGDPRRVIFISEIFFSCENGNNNSAYFMELLWELNKLMHVKTLNIVSRSEQVLC